MNNNIIYDQYFLIDKEVAKLMVGALSINKNEKVLEIGPGKGFLTRILAEKNAEITAVEIDPFLANGLKNIPRTEIVNDNAIDFLDNNKGKIKKIISSLPSSIVEPIIKRMIKINFNEAVFLIPLKFFYKLQNELIYKSFFETTLLAEINPSSFSPEPKTNWSAVKIIKKNRLKDNDKKEAFFRYLYFHPKTKFKNLLLEGIINYGQMNKKKITKNQSREIVKSLGINLEKLEQFVVFDEELQDLINKIFIALP